jgi:tetratricopeptide (TPR) repeat protein
MGEAHRRVAAGDYAGGIDTVNELMGVEDARTLPEKFDSDEALGALERATLKQALGEYESSARDFQAADKELEILDLSTDAVGTLGRYIYSDSSEKYHASPTEMLAVNSFNMMNYLARGDLRGARVEARRFTVIRAFLEEQDPGLAIGAAGAFLAGFTMEQLGEITPAMRYYDEALQLGDLDSLAAPVHRLAERSPYRGERLEPFLAATAPGARPREDQGELLILVNVGRVPFKIPKRMPVGAAVGLAGSWISGNPEILGYSVFKVVVYPELTNVPSIVGTPQVSIGDEPVALEEVSDLAAEIRDEYEALKPKILGAALSRLIVRAAAAEAARAGGNRQGSGLGWALALLVEGALVAMDKPDTRSWNFLPARVLAYRGILDAGSHEIEVRFTGDPSAVSTHQVSIEPGGFGVLVVTAPR